MKELNHCPSTLADGFSTYSPTACKKLFDRQDETYLFANSQRKNSKIQS